MPRAAVPAVVRERERGEQQPAWRSIRSNRSPSPPRRARITRTSAATSFSATCIFSFSAPVPGSAPSRVTLTLPALMSIVRVGDSGPPSARCQARRQSSGAREKPAAGRGGRRRSAAGRPPRPPACRSPRESPGACRRLEQQIAGHLPGGRPRARIQRQHHVLAAEADDAARQASFIPAWFRCYVQAGICPSTSCDAALTAEHPGCEWADPGRRGRPALSSGILGRAVQSGRASVPRPRRPRRARRPRPRRRPRHERARGA